MKNYAATVTVRIPVTVAAKGSAEARRLAAEAVEQRLGRMGPGAAIAGATARSEKDGAKTAPAPPLCIDFSEIEEKLGSFQCRESAREYLEFGGFDKRALAAIAERYDLRGARGSKADVIGGIVEMVVGARLDFASILNLKW